MSVKPKGDNRKATVPWDRQQTSIDLTKNGGNILRNNTTGFRTIECEDIKLREIKMITYGQLKVKIEAY